ncbi:MAG: hypothetical protein AB7V62_12380 [Thermoleophilia bacterium]
MAAHPLVGRIVPHLAGEVHAVGGVVRDALLGLPAAGDADLVVEGPAIPLAREVGRAVGARVVAHERFGTAALEMPHGGTVDLVTARTESYARPGALPDVAPGTLIDDLARRDFTVNAMALGLSGTAAGRLTDPHGGLADLDARLVRALRPGSFAEDPSRLVRAARYAARLGFALAPETEAEARRAAPSLDPSSARVADELERLLGEGAAGEALALLAALGVPWALADAPLRLAAIDAAAARDGAPPVPPWALRLGAGVAPDAAARAAVPGWAAGVAAEVARGPALATALAAAGRPSEIDRVLRTTPGPTAIAALAGGAEAVAAWWTGDRDRQPLVGGADLVAAGIPPGPAIGRALAAVRALLLDGHLQDDVDVQVHTALRLARGEDAP